MGGGGRKMVSRLISKWSAPWQRDARERVVTCSGSWLALSRMLMSAPLEMSSWPTWPVCMEDDVCQRRCQGSATSDVPRRVLSRLRSACMTHPGAKTTVNQAVAVREAIASSHNAVNPLLLVARTSAPAPTRSDRISRLPVAAVWT